MLYYEHGVSKNLIFTFHLMKIIEYSGIKMSLSYLKEAIENNDSEKLIRSVRFHFGDGNEEKAVIFSFSR